VLTEKYLFNYGKTIFIRDRRDGFEGGEGPDDVAGLGG
jgi:hypothetical protein